MGAAQIAVINGVGYQANDIGSKLMEHAYLHSPYLFFVFKKIMELKEAKVVWLDDYYLQPDDIVPFTWDSISIEIVRVDCYDINTKELITFFEQNKFLVNKTTKQFIDLLYIFNTLAPLSDFPRLSVIHPFPILVRSGVDQAGFSDIDDSVFPYKAQWRNNVISLTKKQPDLTTFTNISTNVLNTTLFSKFYHTF